MPFLRSRDYTVYIQSQQLAQITNDPSRAMTNLEVRINAEDDAIEEASEYLQQKYDVTAIFTETYTYNTADTYGGNDRVELTAPAWVAQAQYNSPALALYTDNKIYKCIANTAALWVSQAYTAGQQVLYTDGKYYQCILNTVGNAAPPNATYWEVITAQIPGNTAFWQVMGWNLQLFYLQFPYPRFDIKCIYKVGDNVFWKGFVYQCQISSNPLDGEEKIQYDDSTQYPFPNAFPDTPTVGLQQWGTGVPYSVTGVGPTDTASAWVNSTPYNAGQTVLYNNILWQSIIPGTATNTGHTPGTDIVSWQPIIWISGDNRNRKLVANLVHIAIWNLHSNIAPQNVPMLREKNHIKAIKWLEDVKKGNLALDALTMQVLEPPQGGRMLLASRPAQNNRW